MHLNQLKWIPDRRQYRGSRHTRRINVKNKYRRLLFFIAVGEPICIHFTRCMWWKKLKVPTSLHLIFIFIKSIQKPIYIHAIFTPGFSSTCFLLISIFSPPSHFLSLLLPFFSFSFFFVCLSLSSIGLSCHSIRRGCRGGTDGFSLRRPCCGFAAAAGLW